MSNDGIAAATKKQLAEILERNLILIAGLGFIYELVIVFYTYIKVKYPFYSSKNYKDSKKV